MKKVNILIRLYKSIPTKRCVRFVQNFMITPVASLSIATDLDTKIKA